MARSSILRRRPPKGLTRPPPNGIAPGSATRIGNTYYRTQEEFLFEPSAAFIGAMPSHEPGIDLVDLRL
jgi:hypothetical protein